MKQRIFSGIKPSGELHLGNYLGAIRQWVGLQEEYDTTLCVVDLHAITVPQEPLELRRRTLDIAKTYLAAGIDPAKVTIFVQSQVPAHAELAWILNTVARMSDLFRMTQFKDKSGISNYRNVLKKKDKQGNVIKKEYITPEEYYEYVLDKTGVGLFDYPVLMAADILLYDTDVVPVGDDQVQHIELTRTLARRFNKRFGDVFTIPQPRVDQESARIMALDNPSKKMSKSAGSEYNYIALNDDPDMARRKIMKAVTDSGSDIVYADEKPALKNLINIHSLLAGRTPQAIEAEYVSKGYADFKRDLGDVVAGFLSDFQSRLADISDEETLHVLRAGAEKARETARKKLSEVYERVGFLR